VPAPAKPVKVPPVGVTSRSSKFVVDSLTVKVTIAVSFFARVTGFEIPVMVGARVSTSIEALVPSVA